MVVFENFSIPNYSKFATEIVRITGKKMKYFIILKKKHGSKKHMKKISMQHCIEESWKYAEIEGLKIQIDLLVGNVSAAVSGNACLRNQLFRAFEELKLAENEFRNQSFETVDEKTERTLENEAIHSSDFNYCDSAILIRFTKS